MNKHFLLQALELAEIRRGFCAPNPAVGAVVVKDNEIIAKGFHWASGHPHAEVEALKQLDESATQDATIYITLEPCCHFGKTPPCTELLIQRNIKQVVYGMQDLNPQVANKSEAILRQAGIDVVYLPLPEITEFYRSYHYWWQTKLPLVTAKIALSLDGKIAGPNGERVQLTGKAAQQFTHQQRKRSDAILTTAKTIINDDPLLNVRMTDQICAKPVYILDSHLTTPLTANIFNSAAKVILFHRKDLKKNTNEYIERGAQCVAVNYDNNGLDLLEVLQQVGADGVHDLWLEAGGVCFNRFLQQNLLQRAYLYLAPKWLGANSQAALVEQIDFNKMGKKIYWQSLEEDGLCVIEW